MARSNYTPEYKTKLVWEVLQGDWSIIHAQLAVYFEDRLPD